ncbi:hypothetical protein B0H12DRAFT_1131513 [Mycena haematopus]|nr:hypothetical protein B0H12DRAFT_1131513 [Mycena haematopus]
MDTTPRWRTTRRHFIASLSGKDIRIWIPGHQRRPPPAAALPSPSSTGVLRGQSSRSDKTGVRRPQLGRRVGKWSSRAYSRRGLCAETRNATGNDPRVVGQWNDYGPNARSVSEAYYACAARPCGQAVRRGVDARAVRRAQIEGGGFLGSVGKVELRGSA